MAVISFKCPNCDGELIFDPSTQKYKCEYCFSLFSQEELDAMKPAQTTEPQNADAAGAGKASGKVLSQEFKFHLYRWRNADNIRALSVRPSDP